MINSKIYLTVPYAQKDAVKALGARWDAANKKWYVTADKDLALFKQWQPQTGALDLPATTTGKPKARASTAAKASVKNTVLGVITQAADKNFMAYNGDQPPWV
ncbi:MAG: DUF5710 domain-containing protein [Methylococcaceae bacterium]